MSKLVLETSFIIILLIHGTAFSQGIDYRECLDCHEGIEVMDRNHAFPCRDCHLMTVDRGRKLSSHDGIIRHPSSPQHMDRFCGACHGDEISRLKNSLHYTLGGIVGQTRYLWGAQPDPMPRHSPSPHPELNPLPEPGENPENPEELVDDLLERRCFACHLGRTPPQAEGFYRGVGCAACHVYYADDGLYRGDDRSLMGKRGYPRRHSFTSPIPVAQCLHCHNGPRVGADYAGLFEHDYHWSFHTPWVEGSVPEPLYLMNQHGLKRDIHMERGLLCVDCHDKGDVMGRGKINAYQGTAVGARCEGCHGSPLKGPGDTRKQKGEALPGRYMDRQGLSHPLPKADRSIPEHDIPEMKNVHCSGCHAAWGFYDYGMSLFRDDREDLSKWGPWRLQGDETVAGRFDDRGWFLGSRPEPGPWFLGWRFRRWENLTLGKDSHDRIVPFRPHYQYLISYVARDKRVVLDSEVPQRGDVSGRGWAYMPFYPHTIVTRGRSCGS